MANLQSLFPKAVNVLGEVKHAERNLWRNVLIVALEDAIGKGWRDYGIGRGYKCERARAYFLEPNRDFAMDTRRVFIFKVHSIEPSSGFNS